MKDYPSPQAGIIKVIATLIGGIVAVGAIAVAAAFLWPEGRTTHSRYQATGL